MTVGEKSTRRMYMSSNLNIDPRRFVLYRLHIHQGVKESAAVRRRRRRRRGRKGYNILFLVLSSEKSNHDDGDENRR